MKLQFINTYPKMADAAEETVTITIENDHWGVSQDAVEGMMRNLWHALFEGAEFPYDESE